MVEKKRALAENLDLGIDEFALDQEWLGQAILAMTWGVELAMAVRDSNMAKSDLELIKAEVDRSVRANPDLYEVLKITETSVFNAVLTSSEYQLAMKKVNDNRYAVDVLQAAVNAIEHRKRALEKLVELHARDYYSKPKASESTKEIMDEVEKSETRSRGKRRRD